MQGHNFISQVGLSATALSNQCFFHFDYLQGAVPPPYDPSQAGYYSTHAPPYHHTGEPSAAQAAYPVC